VSEPKPASVSPDFVAAVRAKLASRRAANAAPAEAPSAVIGGLQEAASVLTLFDVETLNPVPGAPSAQDERDPLPNEGFRYRSERETLIAGSTPQYGEGAQRQWVLTPERRIPALRQLRESHRLQAALDANPERPRQPLQECLEAYLTGKAKPIEDQNLVEITALQQVAAWLYPAGFTNTPEAATIQRHAEWLKLLQPFKHLAGEYFRGRQKELQRLRSYVGVVPPGSIFEVVRRTIVSTITAKVPLMIYGPGGVGKSSLVSRFILEHAQELKEDRFPFAYLDFERPEITAAEPLTLLIEAVRQLGIEYPESQERCEKIRADWLQKFRSDEHMAPQENLDEPPAAPRSVPQLSPQDLFAAVRDFASLMASLGAADRPVVIVLDTFEEVQWRSEEHVAAVWNLLDQLKLYVPRFCPIVVGRAPVANRSIEAMELTGLDNEAAIGYLRKRGVSDSALAIQIVRSIGGSPMNLQLAADLVVREGIRSASDLGVTTREFLWFRLDDAHVQRQLHKRVLGHIHDVRVRQLAGPGLVLRRITSELILQVLNGPCGLRLETLEQANELFAELGREVALVQHESDGSLAHRPELRRQVLGLLRADEPQKVAQIHQLAVEYYAGRSPNVHDRAEEIYHRLALGQERSIIEAQWLPGIEPYLHDAFDELTGSLRAYLGSRLGIEVDAETRQLAGIEDYEEIIKRKAAELLTQRQASQVLVLLSERQERAPDGPLFVLEATALAQLGQLPEAFAALDRGIGLALSSGSRRQVLDLVLHAAGLALASRQIEFARWLSSRLQALSQGRLEPEDRVGVLARAIALTREFSVPILTEGDLQAHLRTTFDGMSDEDLVRRPDVSRWAAVCFRTGDVARLSRVLKKTGVPRTGADVQLRDLASHITNYDVLFSKNLGGEPGVLAKELGVPIHGTITASWSEFLLTGAADIVQQTLCRLLDEHAQFIPEAVMSAFGNLMRAAVAPELAQPSTPQVQMSSEGPSPKFSARVKTRLREAMLRTLPNEDALKRFLDSRLNVNLNAIAAGGTLARMIDQVIQWAELQGALTDLVESVRQANPSDADFAEIADELGVGTVIRGSIVSSRGSLQDVSVWRERLGIVEGQVCRVEIDALRDGLSNVMATGFLVGPDLVLTADNVLESVHAGNVFPYDIRVRFDYKGTGSGAASQGTVFRAAIDGIVSRDPYTSQGGLGYCLLRLENTPGTQPIGGAQAGPSDALRNWINLYDVGTLSPGDELVLLHHAAGKPLKLSTGKVVAMPNDAPTLITYDLPTEPGSSGAPCFTMDFRIAAMHIGSRHPGPSFSPGVSYGTRISAITEHLGEAGHGDVIGRELA
jgi:hypothetical protein